MPTPAVFLDRDGTFIEDVGYVDQLDRLRLYPWSIEAVRLLRGSGYAVVILTNQTGVARGMVKEHIVHDVLALMQQRLAAVGQCLDGHYYCPHLPDAPVAAYRRSCSCHKPQLGMVHQAAADLDLDLGRSVVVGDRWTDVRLARPVGAKGILVETGYGVSQATIRPDDVIPDAVVGNLIEAVGWMFRHLPSPQKT